MESKTDQSKYTKNEIVQAIRIENSINKDSDAIWNLHGHYINNGTEYDRLYQIYQT